MALEYSLEVTILVSLEAIPLRITCKCIRSHQDNEETQLNMVMTDLVHINCTVYATINNKSVTGQICKSLFDTANHPRL
jgi:hypothetical protein